MSLPPLLVRHLGLVPYEEALALQRSLRQQRLAGESADTLLLLQHPPTITITRRFGRKNVLASDEELRGQGVTLLEVDRGGDVTAHNPGQLVAYPIVQLAGHERDLPRYMRNLEGAVLDVLAELGLAGVRIPGESGVFLAPTVPAGMMEKVCAMGVKGTRFVMSHGLALNVCNDLSLFSRIIPCGLSHRGVTSLQQRLGTSTPSLDSVAGALAARLAHHLGRELT